MQLSPFGDLNMWFDSVLCSALICDIWVASLYKYLPHPFRIYPSLSGMYLSTRLPFAEQLRSSSPNIYTIPPSLDHLSLGSHHFSPSFSSNHPRFLESHYLSGYHTLVSFMVHMVQPASCTRLSRIVEHQR